MIYFLIVLTQLFICILTNTIQISLQPAEYLCLLEDIPQHVILNIKTQSQTAEFVTQLNFGTQMLIDCYDVKCQKHLTTQKFGVYKLCIKNPSSNFIKVSLYYAYGKKARDFGSNNHKDSIKDLNAISTYAERFTQQLTNENREGIITALEEFKSPLRDHYGYLFSGLFIVATLILSAVQYKLVQKVLKYRKYI